MTNGSAPAAPPQLLRRELDCRELLRPREVLLDAGRPATTMHRRSALLPCPLLLALLALACDGSQATTPPEGSAGPGAASAPTSPEPPDPSAEAPANSPELAAGAGGVSLDVANRCSDPIDYCLVYDGVEKRTRLNGSSHEWFEVAEGATVRKDDGGSCGEVLFTATAEPTQSFALCE